MAGVPLRQDLTDTGAQLVDAADDAGLCPAAAAWLYDHELGEWRFYLVSPLVGIIEKRRLYEALSVMMARMDLPEDFSSVDVFLDGTHGFAFTVIGKAMQIIGNTETGFAEHLIEGVTFDGLIYRFDAEKSAASPEAVESFAKREGEIRREDAMAVKRHERETV